MDPITHFLSATNTSDREIAKQYLNSSGGDYELAVAKYHSVQPSRYVNSKPVKKMSGGVMSMSEIINKNNSNDSEQDFYAGGSKESGIAVSGGPKSNELINNILKKAREGPTNKSEAKDSNEKFSGDGYRLGDTNYGSKKPTVVAKDKGKMLKKTVIFYRNGFIVEGRDVLRSYTNPVDQDFLKDLKDGYVPHEFESAANGQLIEIQIQDRKSEDYAEAEKPVEYFTGTGYSLGNVVHNTGNIKTSSVKYVLDESKPIVKIQVKFSDGTREVAQMNTDQTILHLRAWIDSKRPNMGNYNLVEGYTAKHLVDVNMKISEAKLAGSTVIQKLV